MSVTYFRSRRPGPESLLEDSVAASLVRLFCTGDHPMWVAGSLRVGAGMPDLLSVWYDPAISTQTFADLDQVLLAYLRAAKRATLADLIDRLNRPKRLVEQCLARLVAREVVTATTDHFSLQLGWRDILPSIVSVEVKAADWKRALQQAARNRLFAHKSFVAFPERLAVRVAAEPVFRTLGIGILAVAHDGHVWVQRRARCHATAVWSYYFQLVALTAKHSREGVNALHRSTS